MKLALSALVTLALCGIAGDPGAPLLYAQQSPPATAAETIDLAGDGRVSAPAIGRRDQPVKINHPAGAVVQAIYVTASGEWAFLPESHFVRTEKMTILAAPPTTYLITTGDSTILKVVSDESPRPEPRPEPRPDPRPDPRPEPDPEPGPEPGPPPINADWAVWIEEQQDRASHPEAVAVMTDPDVRANLQDRNLKVRIYDDDQPEAKWLVDKTGGIRPAFLLFQDRGPPRVFPAPKSPEELETIIRENVVR